MREAVTVAPNTIELRETSPPGPPGPGEALLDIAAVGLCGSDLELFRGSDPYSSFPVRQGHEYSARIAALGTGTSDGLRVGDLVAVEPLFACGSCIACRRGHRNACMNLRVTGAHLPGAFADQLLMPVANLYPANHLTPHQAAFVEPVSIGLHMVTRSGLQAGDQAVVFGAGPIGQSVILAARDRGVRLLAVDRLASRLELAQALGVEAIVNTSVDNVDQAIGKWTAGEGPVGVFEATGSTQIFRKALEVAAHGGTVVVAGTPTGEVSIPPFLIVFKELNVLGSRNNAGVFGQAVEIVRRNLPLVDRLITHAFPLERLQEAIEFAIANPQTTEKVMITVSG